MEHVICKKWALFKALIPQKITAKLIFLSEMPFSSLVPWWILTHVLSLSLNINSLKQISLVQGHKDYAPFNTFSSPPNLPSQNLSQLVIIHLLWLFYSHLPLLPPWRHSLFLWYDCYVPLINKYFLKESVYTTPLSYILYKISRLYKLT